MKILFVLFISALFMTACDEKDCCSGIPGDDVLFEFSVVNDSGVDLLDQDNQESFYQSNIRLYNSDGNDTSMVFNENSDAPYGYAIIERESTKRIRPSFAITDDLEVVGYIKWNETDLDTLQLTLVQQSTNVKRLAIIKFNGSEVWNEQSVTKPDNRYFQIVK
ncbi:MAG: hypothetical protein GY816_03650 [Cytophagales bacterium]|nr:hypothetical protein [Cytophagales bacterium]